MSAYEDLIPNAQEGSGASAYADLIPAGGAPAKPTGAPSTQAVTGRTQVPAPRRDPSDDAGETAFITGNLNKGIAGLAGLPVDTARNVGNLGIAAYGMMLPPGQRGDAPQPMQGGVGSSDWIQEMMRRGGMIGPGAEPQSAGGRYAASALQALPGAAIGRPSIPQVPRALGAAATSGLGAEAGADVGGEEWRGVGAMAPGASRIQRGAPGERATAGRQAEAFGKARDMGIPVPPSALKPDKAQQAMQDTGNKALRQPAGTEFSHASIMARNAAHYADYEAVMKSPALAKGVIPTPAFQKEIQAMGDQIESSRSALPETFKGLRPVSKLLAEYGYVQMPQGVKQGATPMPPRAQPIPPDAAMQAVKKLRNDASANFASDKPEKVELAKVQKRLAGSIEDMIEENLARTGDQALMATYKGARTAIAQGHDYLSALEPGGRINGAKLAAMQSEGAPLSGGTKDIAQVAGAFPGAVGRPKDDDMFTKRVSPMAVTHPAAVAAHQIPRMMDRAWMNPVGQAAIDPRGYLTPEQQQLLRYLSAATSQNRGGDIPVPPR